MHALLKLLHFLYHLQINNAGSCSEHRHYTYLLSHIQFFYFLYLNLSFVVAFFFFPSFLIQTDTVTT